MLTSHIFLNDLFYKRCTFLQSFCVIFAPWPWVNTNSQNQSMSLQDFGRSKITWKQHIPGKYPKVAFFAKLSVDYKNIKISFFICSNCINHHYNVNRVRVEGRKIVSGKIKNIHNSHKRTFIQGLNNFFLYLLD